MKLLIAFACLLAVASATYGGRYSKISSGIWKNYNYHGRRWARSVGAEEIGEISQDDIHTAEQYFLWNGRKQPTRGWNNNWSHGRRWARSAEESGIAQKDIDSAELYMGYFNGRWIFNFARHPQ